jgi:hypothetical protein
MSGRVSEAAGYVAARLAQKRLSPHRLVASLRASARSELPYGELRAALADRGLAFEASSQPWERLLRSLDPDSSGVVRVERLIALLLEEERAAAPRTTPPEEPHPYPALQSHLRGAGCTCPPATQGGAVATQRSALCRLAAAMAAVPGARCGLLRELRRADSGATGQCDHVALVDCFARAAAAAAAAPAAPAAPAATAGGQQPLLAITPEESLAFCASSSPTGTTVAYQQLLEDIVAAAAAGPSDAADCSTAQPAALKGSMAAAGTPKSLPAVPAVPALPAAPAAATAGSSVVVESDLTGSRVTRRDHPSSRAALAFEGAAGAGGGGGGAARRRDTLHH